ncbi:collagen alpha-5(VI) chain [Erinaceus europaeus]|uniref:Collagen alpha-5(VI) chain n=1 Tax=Erinaceus europaeus TaxID=9365 RepID=A0ABM3WJR1_ERIEU|nr:collagen alpha-5(VI) chain [Erinaceus europaeus]
MKSILIIFGLILRTETVADQSPGPGPEFADVVFLLDSSDHLGSKSFPFVRTFISKMISSLPIEATKYRVGLAQYTDMLHTEFQLHTFKSRNPMLNHLKKNFGFIGGSLQIGNALREAHTTFFSRPTNGRDKKQFPPILVVLASAESEDDVEEAAEALQRDGVRIISVGLQQASEENLRAMATAQFHYRLRTVRDLSTFSSSMMEIIKNATKYREVEADTDEKVPLPVVCQKDSLADLMFLVDESVGSMQNLRNVKSFLEDVTSSLDVKSSCTRLGLMSYSTGSEIISFLNSSTTQSEFQQQIQKLSLRTGKSNAGAAIETLRREGFLDPTGSRRAQGVPQMAVLITHRPADDEVRRVAQDLRQEDITMFTMSIKGANSTQIEEIASYPPEKTISQLDSYRDLRNYSTKFVKKIQNEIWSQISTRSELVDLDKTGCVDTKEADIYFLIDGSSSIERRDFDVIKEFMSKVVDMFSIGPNRVQVGVVQYSDKIQEEFNINLYTNKVDLTKAIFNVKQLTGGTYIGEALDFTLSKIQEGRKLRPRPAPCYLIVLTDGDSSDSVLEPAERLRAEQITIYAVGIGNAKKIELQQIAGTEERVIFGQNFDSLKIISNDVVHGICTEKGCEDMKIDIMFLVDSSHSIGLENFGKMKTFMKNVLDKIQIGPNKTHIGAAQFSTNTKEEFQLDEYFTKGELFDAIDRMPYMDQTTLTGKALTFVDQYFSPLKGARTGVRQFLILITDGEAQDDVQKPAKVLRDKGITIFSVGVYGANRTQLEEISGEGSRVFQVEKFDDLKTIESKLIFRVCALHDCKRIEMLDIVFVLDHSGSIGVDQQESMMNLTLHLVEKAGDQVQFGALIYSNEPTVLFHLNTHPNKAAIAADLRKRRSTGGETYTAKALKHSDGMFTEEHGSRIKQNVKQVLIIITDGESHDRTDLSQTAQKLRDKGVTIYAVGVGEANRVELETMAGNKDNAIHVENFDKLKDIYLPIQEGLCNATPAVCNIQEADVVFLLDGSDLVSNLDFVTMTTFLSELIDNLDTQSQKINIGMAQFGELYSEIVRLGSSLTRTEWKTRIQMINKITGIPQMDLALKKVRYMFDSSAGGRRNAGVPQTLVIITSGAPSSNVAEAVKVLKDLGICVLVWGIGDVYKEQLLPITENAGKIITLQEFNKLKDGKVKKRMVREVCQSCKETNCFVDIVVGFDISTHLQGQNLFKGQTLLKSSLPGILEDITSIRGVSCGAGTATQVSVAFKVNPASSAKFHIYQRAIFDSLLLPVTVEGPTHLNAEYLQALWDTFEDEPASRGKVLLIFSDGLGGESMTTLEDQSDRLRKAGLDGLLVVSLNTTAPDEFSSFEFGKGFDYRTHLTIGMTEVGKMLSRYLENIAERTCCCTFCKCSGPPGRPGTQGPSNLKGVKGQKGSRGHRGEDGDPGGRGETGPTGEKGIAGCPGEQGQKGALGYTGSKGEPGEDGVDGLDGEEGFHGLPGKKGEKGDLGYQGSPGSRGAPGVYGEKGFRGDPGNAGTNNNIRGRKGSKGEQGRQGRTGQKGTNGSPSSIGIRGRGGQRGPPGAPGNPGAPGPKGELGAEGLQGPQGSTGIPGRKGEVGNPGHKGPQGPNGPVGAKGSDGRPGLLGKKGEPGLLGDPGPQGQVGQRGKQGDNGIPGYGPMGRKGVKGPRGFPGDMGQKGDIGDPGIPGGPGPKGYQGVTLSGGSEGAKGSHGHPGLPGRRGAKGMAGQPEYPLCDLIQFLRNHTPCWKEKCPAYPTELVFALDQSHDTEEQRFNQMREMIISIVKKLHIRENNCPVGARVVVVSYDSQARYLIRRSDYHSKKQLLQLLSQISYQRPMADQDIGDAMRFVARHIFKRTFAGGNVRKVAVFFNAGQAVSQSSIITATMEFSALDITPAVITFDERLFLDEAFEFDDTGTFQVIPGPSRGINEPPERLWLCTLCYDKCFPNACSKDIILPENAYMDVALVLDNSRHVASEEFQALKTLVSAMLDNFIISSDPLVSDFGDRIALLTYSPWDHSQRNQGAVKTEFDFTTYDNHVLMKSHIQTYLQQLHGDEAIGPALLWTMENLFPSSPYLRKHKVIFVVSAGENQENKEFLRKMALRAKCQGYVIFVISLGSLHNHGIEEIASYPPDHHLIQLGRIHKPDLNYILKFLKPFVYSVRQGFNQYPPRMLESACSLINSEAEDDGKNYLLMTPEPPEISLADASFTSQELNAGRNISFLLASNGSGHLVYVPNHLEMPQELMSKYEKDHDSEEIISLIPGNENQGRNEEPGLTYKPGDASLQEYFMDVAFLIDASHRVGNDGFKEVKDLIISVLDYFYIAPDPLTSPLGDRVALLSYSPPGYLPDTEECPVYLEFDLVTYNSVYQMKHHLQDSFRKLNGDVFLGHALQWTIDNVFVGTPNLKKNKVIFVISAGETNILDKEFLRNVSLRAKCQGYAIFVFSFGPIHNDKELEELASHPLDHHLVQLGRTHKPDLNYIIKFVKPFIHIIRRAINKYPHADLRPKCENITSPKAENEGTENTPFLTPGVYEIETENSELFGSQEQHFFVLGDNHSNDSGTTTDLIQKLYILLSTGQVMMRDKKEAHSEEITPPANGIQHDDKDGEDTK